ncbi:molybdopterin-dependent oxidoreductase [Spirosoma taeanense]|uniref:nitrate reductase (cytochrome) n=1 Tax=Spirosoma taeanense TaxID=2735870 RepID=A0A6M5YCJ3_9BACT|nr:nitrate reductase [Spirosoma taeanense]QJW91818.1 molybdopterin-dependent oxidoreductase [Spirosoma taeanense]
MTQLKSTCSYCGVGCGVLVNKDRTGHLTVQGDPNHPGSKGMLCSKGMNLHYTVMDQSDRLLYPQMRYNRSMPLERVSWDDALDRAAAVFRSLIARYGPDSVGFYASGQCLTEEYYLINKLTKGFLGTNNLDTNSRLCMSSAVVGYKMALGEDSVPCSYEDIDQADTLLVAGANPAWCHPIIFRRVEARKAAFPDFKLIVIDPRRTQTASMADLHLQIRPGTDITLYHAIARGLIDRGLIDQDFIDNHTEGFAAFNEKVHERTLKEAASICGISVEDLKWAIEYIGRAKGFMTMWAMGLNQSVVGVNKNVSLLNLSLITGQIGKPGAGPLSLTGQPNAMGGRETGGMSNLLPAHRDMANPQHRQEVADFWGVPSVPAKPGYTATEMFEALRDGRMKAVWIVTTNPMVSLPDSKLVEEALQNARFVVVQDISNRSDTLAYADLVLPAAGWGEKAGTMTNSERRISYLNKFTDAPGEARPDAEIIWTFARKMGFGAAFNYASVAEVYDEHVRLTRGTRIDISGLSHERLKTTGTIQWPVPTRESTGTARLFEDRQFYTPSRKAQIKTVSDENQSEATSSDFPLILTTGRIRDQWHTMTRTGKVAKLNTHIPKPFLEIHPKDAEERSLREGDPVVITSARGEVRVNAKLTKDIRRGVVFLPMHWGKLLNDGFARANNLTQPLIDPISKEPDFKFSAVQVARYVKPQQKIIIVGAGAAATRFVNTYRELNTSDELHVFSKEINPFYNRVMLPDYVSGVKAWDNLIKLTPEAAVELGVHLHIGVTVETIDRTAKTITDSRGETHSYDILLLTPGSRAFMPREYVTDLKGVLTMRTRHDADALLERLGPGDPCVIVGGGLLGLELAASLREIGVGVTVIQRENRLMTRQLDAVASELLHQELTDRGVEILYNESIRYYVGEKAVEGVHLANGQTIPARAVVFAIGTQPNTELARACGLPVNRGVVVNEYLQTADPSIYSAGEVAELNGQLWGITAAAEEQADVIARHLNGDLVNYYTGSLSMNILKMDGLQLCSLGIPEAPTGVENYEEVVFIDRAKRYYKKCIIHQDRLVGAILIGDKTEFLEYKDLIHNRTELSDKRLSLLRSGQAPKPVLGKLVCSCNSVGEGNLTEAVKAGATEFGKLCQTTGAGTGCGSCKPEVKAILERIGKKVASVA